jgi:hypothetical protein
LSEEDGSSPHKGQQVYSAWIDSADLPTVVSASWDSSGKEINIVWSHDITDNKYLGSSHIKNTNGDSIKLSERSADISSDSKTWTFKPDDSFSQKSPWTLVYDAGIVRLNAKLWNLSGKISIAEIKAPPETFVKPKIDIEIKGYSLVLNIGLLPSDIKAEIELTRVGKDILPTKQSESNYSWYPLNPDQYALVIDFTRASESVAKDTTLVEIQAMDSLDVSDGLSKWMMVAYLPGSNDGSFFSLES